ncbi:MAG: AraC family transcriptional regulator [Alloalcanivorax venustensis]|uniref:AraC family transcriptional regulator n=1 Tax=Alloalcanivorax venustensis TaxID=172371 RepID=UPI003297855C
MHISPAVAGTDRSVSAAFVDSVLPDLLAHYRLQRATVLEQAGIDGAVFNDPGRLLPLLDVMRLFLVILEACGDPGLGFETGRRVRPRSYQVLGYVILASRDLDEAIERLMRFEKLSGNLGRTERHDEGDQVRLCWQCPVAGEPGRMLTEAAITRWVTFMRPLMPPGAAPAEVCFRHPPPADAARYRDWFQAPVRFDADFDGVRLPAALLRHSLQSADPGLGRMMEKEAGALLADFDAHGNLLSRVRSAIYRRLGSGDPSVDAVAAELGLTVRTLQSRLQRQGLAYQEVLDGLRRSLAELYLRDPALNLTEIALLLGFAESSSFSRAFRRWRGESPVSWRRRLPRPDPSG